MEQSTEYYQKVLFNQDFDVTQLEGEEDHFGVVRLKSFTFSQEAPAKLNRFTLIHIIKGSGTFNLALEKYSVNKDCIYFGYPGQIISGIELKNIKGYVIYAKTVFMLMANPDLLEFRLFQLYGKKHVLELDPILNSKLLSLAKIMHEESISQDSRKEEILHSMVNLHILYTERLLDQTMQEEEIKLHPKVRAFFAQMNLNENVNFAVSDYAAELNITPNYLNELVKSQIGKSVKTLIKEKIIRRACVLLLHTDMETKEIAYHLGYSYPQYFNQDFKKAMNVTPLQYRERNRG
jgi:YesN/AraC family two-component response regulator